MPVSREYLQDWFNKANNDLTTARLSMSAGGPPDVIAVLLQQASEKYLKAYLMFKGWRLKKTHDLSELLEKAAEFDTSFNEYKELTDRLTLLYIEERYPSGMALESLGGGEIGRLMEQTEKLIAKIRASTSH